MTYFLLLPLFLLWLICAIAATAATRFVSQLNQLFPYVWRVSLWATIGCVLANATLLWMLSLMERAGAPLFMGSFAEQALQLTFGLALLAGPLLASAAGWSAGALLGALLAFLDGRRKLLKPALTAQ